jgi:SnoaL-like domain
MRWTTTELRALAEHWIQAWNSRNLDEIMFHYASNVEFEANTVVRRWGRLDGKLVGIDELREHFRVGLELAPNLRFEMEDVFTVPTGYAVLYRRENNNRIIDVVELNREGKASRVRAFYAGEQK